MLSTMPMPTPVSEFSLWHFLFFTWKYIHKNVWPPSHQTNANTPDSQQHIITPREQHTSHVLKLDTQKPRSFCNTAQHVTKETKDRTAGHHTTLNASFSRSCWHAAWAIGNCEMSKCGQQSTGWVSHSLAVSPLPAPPPGENNSRFQRRRIGWGWAKFRSFWRGFLQDRRTVAWCWRSAATNIWTSSYVSSSWTRATTLFLIFLPC